MSGHQPCASIERPRKQGSEIRRLIGILGEAIGRAAKIAGPMDVVLPI